MDELAMTRGLIPVRGLPGVVKLPRRYEKAALGDARTARFRRVSLCSNLVVGEGMGDRLDDLMTAIMWVKQELILLRQHDILLKRQFFDIHHSITSIKTRRSQSSTSSSHPSTPSPSASLAPPTGSRGYMYDTCSAPSTPPVFSLAHSRSTTPDSGNEVYSTPLSSPVLPARNQTSAGNHLPSSGSEHFLDLLLVRPSASVTMLHQMGVCQSPSQEDEDTDGDDTFDEDFFRPRTSSMRTSRDLAALARRRGSKELVGI